MAALTLALAAGVALAAEGAASAAVRAADPPAVVVSGLPALPTRPEVRARLASGLTNTFAIVARAEAEEEPDHEGGALVEVRYEPWDETYQVVVQPAVGDRRELVVASLEAFAQWWSELEVAVLDATSMRTGAAWRLEGEVRFLPFSESEERSARTWLRRSLSARGGTGERDTARASSRVLVDLLMATSVRRQTLVTARWTAVLRWPQDGGAGRVP